MASLWKRMVVQCTGRGLLMFVLVVMAIVAYTFVKFFMAVPDPIVDRSPSVPNYRTSGRGPNQQIKAPSPQKPPTIAKPAEPPKKEIKPPEPPKMEKPEEPPKEKKYEEPPKPPKEEQKQEEAPKEQKQEEAPKEQKQEEPPKEQKQEEPPKEQKQVEPPKEQKQEEPPKEQKQEEPPKEQKQEEPPKEQKQEEPPNEQKQEEPPKEQKQDEPPKKQTQEEPPKEQKQEETPMEKWKKDEPQKEEKQIKLLKKDKQEPPMKEKQPAQPIKQKEESEEAPSGEAKKDEPQQQQAQNIESFRMEQHSDIPLDPNEAQSVVRQLQQTGNTLLDHFLVNNPSTKPTGFASWVHLDLKGAAPTMDYLMQLVPLLKKWGATGILIEYEDMFPWEKEVAVIKAPNAYTRESLKSFLREAKNNDLEVVPLIQTFGHMELLLKHATFQSLREDQRYPAFLNPAKPLSLVLLKLMIDQVLGVHADSNYFHIGCDEVNIIGTSEESKAKMREQNNGVAQLYLEHVKTLAEYVKSKNPDMQTLIWDDMMRHMSTDDLLASNIASYIEPVIWSYSKMVQNEITEAVWKKYAQVFTNIWVGSAFKGASGAVQHLPELSVHLQNHAKWVEVINNLAKTHSNLKVQGFMLTGWSRYDHFSALCDLLPASIPSLVACLQIVKSGTWTPSVIQEVSSLLQCTGPVFALNPETLHFGYAFEVPTTQEMLANNYKKQCSFPGDDIFYIILIYHQALQTFEKYFDPITGQTRGQCNRFSLGHNFVNPFGVETLCSGAAERVMKVFKLVDKRVPVVFRNIYSDSVASEWLEEHVITFEAWLEQYNNNVKSVASKAQVWGERPVKFLDKYKPSAGLP